jgi:hypothetical protein
MREEAEKWVNDGDWGYPVDKVGEWMYSKLVEAFEAGWKAKENQSNKQHKEDDKIQNIQTK